MPSNSVLAPSPDPTPVAECNACFHCRQLVREPGRWQATLDGALREFCCAGCEAVARTIHGAGLAGFYQRRQTAAAPLPAAEDFAARYDAPSVQRELVREHADGSREASLLLEGIQCAACVWLNETHLARLPGVVEVSINYATRRARVRWRPEQIRLSGLLAAVAAIGYRAHPYDPEVRERVARRESRALLLRAGVAALAMMQVMMFAAPGYVSSDGVDPEHERLFRWASLALSTPAVLFSGWPFLAGALRSLRQRLPGMDLPVALGIVVAFLASAWATWTGAGPVYYDSVTMFLALLLGARYFELRARQRAVEAVESIARAVPVSAERLLDYPASLATEAVTASELAPGGAVLVRPGATVPADGVVVEGSSHADESLVTGESWPVPKQAGDPVMAGSVNRETALVIRVTRAASESRASQIARLVERALHQRPPIATLAERVAAWAVVGILVCAAASGLLWWLVEPARALPIAVAVLVVSCPCALSLAVPTALAAASGALARRGVLVTRGDAVECMARVSDVVFDKTGTLTEGRFSLVGVEPLRDRDRARCIALAATLESGSEHPVATALREVAGAGLGAASELASVAGSGVEGRVDGTRYRIGRPDWAGGLHGLPAPRDAGAAGAAATPIALADERGWIAWFTFADRVRADAAATVAALAQAGLRVHLLSGDRPATVAHVASLLGIDSFAGGLDPEDKVRRLQALQRGGARVLMVGDGVNDAPVLAGAHVSAAMASGSPLAMVSADLVLLGHRLDAIRMALGESRRTMRVVRQNFGWAILYNAIAMPAAAAGMITPLAAGIGMSLSSLLVVLNSMRLVGRRDSAANAQHGIPADAPPAAIASAAAAPSAPGLPGEPGADIRRWTSSTC